MPGLQREKGKETGQRDEGKERKHTRQEEGNRSKSSDCFLPLIPPGHLGRLFAIPARDTMVQMMIRSAAMAALAAGALFFTTLGIAQTAPSTLPAGKLARDVYFLSADEREGRGAGTKGLDQAADFVADRFKSLGLRTLPGSSDYFQPFLYTIPTGIAAPSELRSGESIFTQGNQYRPLSFSADGKFNAPVVFAGYGITDEKRNYDDYAGVDVKGKVVLLLRYGPKGDAAPPQASLNSKASNAAAHGAVALLLVNPPKYHGEDQLLPFDGGDASSKIPFIHVTQELANDLLKRGGASSLVELQDAIDSDLKPRSALLKDVTVTGNVLVERKKVPLKNVMAYLPGGKKPDEYVVVGAHYDHLGRGGQGSLARLSKEIHNGADDNASGTAALLAMAEKLVYAGRRDRSIIFVLFAGEELGLLGSQHFVENPPVPLKNIVSMLNLDMVGRVRNDVIYIGGSGTAASFDSILAAADKASPLEIKSIGKGGRGPSDHQSFAMKNIPVIFFFSGMHQDYHRPSDDAEKINYRGINDVVDFGFRVLDGMATMPRQTYVAKFDTQPTALTGSGSRGARVSLGVVPNYGMDETTGGVIISGTSPGSPAELAGLKDGDTITRIGAKTIDNLYDLTDFLADAKPGDEVTIYFERNKQRMQTQATLVERKG